MVEETGRVEVTSSVTSCADILCPQYNVSEGTLHLCEFFPQTHNLSLITQMQIEDHSSENIADAPQKCPGHERPGKTEKPPPIGGDKVNMMPKRSVESGMEPRTEKRLQEIV